VENVNSFPIRKTYKQIQVTMERHRTPVSYPLVPPSRVAVNNISVSASVVCTFVWVLKLLRIITICVILSHFMEFITLIYMIMCTP